MRFFGGEAWYHIPMKTSPIQEKPNKIVLLLGRILWSALLGWVRSLQLGAALVLLILVIINLQELGFVRPLAVLRPVLVLEGTYTLAQLVAVLQGGLLAVGIVFEGIVFLGKKERGQWWQRLPYLVQVFLMSALLGTALLPAVSMPTGLMLAMLLVVGLVMYTATRILAWLHGLEKDD